MRSLLTSLIAVALAVAPVAQSNVVNGKLSGPMQGDARSFVVRSGRVAYMADQDVLQQVEVFGVSVDGTAPAVKLNGVLVSGGDVTAIELSSDGSTVVYRANAETINKEELYSVPADGSAAPVKLNGPLEGGSVNAFHISPDGARVVYAAGGSMYSVPTHGGTPVWLDFATSFEITPDSTHVVYPAPLSSVPIDGSGPAVEITNEVVQDFALSPDGSRIVYRVFGSLRLYSAPVSGGAASDLSGTLVAGGHVTAYAFAPSVNGMRVVYLADKFVDERFELSSVPVGGGFDPSIVLSGPLVAPGSDVLDFRVSPDDEHVVYLADQDVDGSERLYRVPVEGTAPAVQLSAADLDDATFEIAPGGAHVVVSGDVLLASLPTSGGSFQPLSSSSTEFLFAFAGRRIVHVESGVLTLTSITSGTSVPLGPEPVGSLHEFAVDGPHVVYRADQDELGTDEIYSTSVDHAGPVEHAPPARTRSISR